MNPSHPSFHPAPPPASPPARVPSRQSGLLRYLLLSLSLLAVLTGSVMAQGTVAAPVFTPPSSTNPMPYSTQVTSATSGASIYYTIDNSDPTNVSIPVPSNGIIPIAGNY